MKVSYLKIDAKSTPPERQTPPPTCDEARPPLLFAGKSFMPEPIIPTEQSEQQAHGDALTPFLGEMSMANETQPNGEILIPPVDQCYQDEVGIAFLYGCSVICVAPDADGSFKIENACELDASAFGDEAEYEQYVASVRATCAEARLEK